MSARSARGRDAARDERMMREALRAARRADGRCHPNPAVGAVVSRGDRVLARGHTREAGRAHAEIVALDAARRRHGDRALRGATLTVTLEPCAHHGRTAPCADAVAASGIARLVVGHRDPNPPVRGRGLRRVRAAGVEVVEGVLADACREQHRGFLSVLERGRPWVALKLAATLDGRIATASGESRWITGERARDQVHRLRDRHDAVVVGSGTARADDPELAVRRGGRVQRVPVRVLVDASLVVPARARLFRDAHAGRTWLLTRRDAPARALAARTARGARAFGVARRGAHLDLVRALERLAAEGLTQVLVEGGGGLGAALLRGGLVDEVHWFAAPAWIGSDGRASLGPLGLRRLAGAPRLYGVRMRRLGDDLYLQGRVAAGSTDGARRSPR